MQDLALAVLRTVAEHGARVGFSQSPAGRMRFAVRGAGRPLLLLHGLGDSIAGWAQVAGTLASRHEVHLLDLPGHGLSGKPPDYRLRTLTDAVAHYARDAGLEKPVIVGHSLGGWIALRLALSGALDPSRLVLVNPGGALLDKAHWEPFLELVSARDRAGVDRYLAAAFHKPPLALRLFPNEVIKVMASEASTGILASLVEDDFIAEAELASLVMPVRLVWGAKDRLLPPGTLDFFRRGLPRAEVVLIPDSGHLPHFESPRALARAISR